MSAADTPTPAPEPLTTQVARGARRQWLRAATSPTLGLVVVTAAFSPVAVLGASQPLQLIAQFGIAAAVGAWLIHMGRARAASARQYNDDLARLRRLLYAAQLAVWDGRRPEFGDGYSLAASIASGLAHETQLLSQTEAMLLARQLQQGSVDARQLQAIIDHITELLGDHAPDPGENESLLHAGAPKHTSGDAPAPAAPRREERVSELAPR